MNNIDNEYLKLLEDILTNGVEKVNRTGVNTISVFGRTIRHKMEYGFPLLTTKKMAWKQIATELFWFLRGESNIKTLINDGNYIWVGDAYKNYLNKCEKDSYEYGTLFTKDEFIENIKTDEHFSDRWGEMGQIYGKQWRNWGCKISNDECVDGIDQIQNLINNLKTDPDSRRLIVNSWNVSDIDEMILPPCHYNFQIYTRYLTDDEKLKMLKKFNFNKIKNDKNFLLDMEVLPKRAISLMWQQRSVDVPLGLPFNIASYGLLLEILAKEVNMVPDELIGVLGDTHIYVNQIDGIEKQLTREPFSLPKINLKYDLSNKKGNLKDINYDDIELIDYIYHSKIEIPLSN